MGINKENFLPQEHNRAFSPLALYQMNPDLGLTLDSSGNGKTLTQTVAPVYSACLKSGRLACVGGHFNRNDNSFRFTDGSGNGTSFSACFISNATFVATWMMGYGNTSTGTSDLNTAWSFGSLNSGGGMYYSHQIDTNTTQTTNMVGGGGAVSNIYTDQWTHYAVVRSGTTLKLYRNGILGRTATINVTNIDSSNAGNSLYIGANPSAASSHSRPYYSLAIYASALTDAQVAYLAKRTVPQGL